METALFSPLEISILDLINDRLEHWRSVLDVQVAFFTQYADLERNNGISFAKMASVLSTAVAPSPSASPAAADSNGGDRHHAWLGPLQNHALKGATDGDTFSKFLKTIVISQLEGLRDKVKTKTKEIRANLSATEGRLRKQHQSLLGAMADVEARWKLRMRLQANPTDEETLSEVLGQSDVYLDELRLRDVGGLFMHEKEAYCAILMDSFYQTRQMEADVAEEMKRIIMEAMQVKGQQLAASAELLKDCQETTMAAAPLMEWQSAIVKHRLDWDWQVTAPPVDGFIASLLTQINCSLTLNSADMADAVVRPINIIRAGFLMKPASFGRWTVLWCVLTDSSHLHCFPTSVFADGSNNPVEEGGVGSGRHFKVPSSSMMLHSRALTELNQAALRIWLATCASSYQAPSISVPLMHPGTIVTAEPELYGKNDHVFSITIPGGTSFFSRAEKKVILKSYLEEDMVDWCIAVKEKVVTMASSSSPALRSSSTVSPTQSNSAAAPTVSRSPLPFGESIESMELAGGFQATDPATLMSQYEEFNSYRRRSSHQATPQTFTSAFEQDDAGDDRSVKAPSIPHRSAASTPIEDLDNPWDK